MPLLPRKGLLAIAAVIDVAVQAPGCPISAKTLAARHALPPGSEGQIRPRSGLAARHGVTVLNTPGTIDADYRGEVMVVLINHGERAFSVTRGMCIAQLIVAPVIRAEILEFDELDPTARGSGGFGSTGG